jgi:hypothetical protein
VCGVELVSSAEVSAARRSFPDKCTVGCWRLTKRVTSIYTSNARRVSAEALSNNSCLLDLSILFSP